MHMEEPCGSTSTGRSFEPSAKTAPLRVQQRVGGGVAFHISSFSHVIEYGIVVIRIFL